MENKLFTLGSLFENSVTKYGANKALWVDGHYYTYDELFRDSQRLATTLQQCLAVSENSLVAIYAYRSYESYISVLGSLMSESAYVPLNPKFPLERNSRILSTSKAKIILVDEKNSSTIEGVIKACGVDSLTIIFVGTNKIPSWCDNYNEHDFISVQDVAVLNNSEFEMHSADLAYVMFTSGSTGVPKGVPISHSNVISYLDNISRELNFKESDRFTQLFDFTFDLSVHDLFICWKNGACLYCVPSEECFMPHKFIKRHEISIWFSVPSMISTMATYRLLKADVFPSIRLSLFCGEALTSTIIDAWKSAAPQSEIINLYGPTEATIAISLNRISNIEESTIPIGEIFDDHDYQILEKDSCELSSSGAGELAISGPQISGQYFQNSAATEKAYFKQVDALKGERIWYRTGDIVKRQENAPNVLEYIGRIDQQIKVKGYRVEILEIENVLREVSSALSVAVVPIYADESQNISHIVAYMSGTQMTDREIILLCSSKLPKYMIPKNIYITENLPVNFNGKVDRKVLSELANVS